MLKNYLKTSLRNLLRSPVYTAINLFGLAVGVACVILIALYVLDEVRYDRFHEKADRIYRVISERQSGEGSGLLAATPASFGPTLEAEFPEVEESVRFYDLGNSLLQVDEKRFFEPKAYFVDASVLDVFTLPLLKGNPATALEAPYSVVLSESVAEKYFDGADPMGKTIRIGEWDMTVTGVAEDAPSRSHIDLNVLASFSTLESFEWASPRLTNWIWQQFFNYVLLAEDASAERVAEKFGAYIDEHVDPITSERGFTYGPKLQPLTDVYLHSTDIQFHWMRSGNAAYVYAFAAIALFILVIACLNFMNLSTARATKRAREVGMRKVIGARRWQLIGQFLSEAVFMAFMALAMALLISEAALPSFNAFTGKSLDLVYGAGPLVPLLILLALVVGVAAGSYPAFFLSSFRPVHVLKGTGGPEGPSLSTVRRVLVVTQFAISITLMIGTAVVFQQMEYIGTADLGFDRDLIVKVPLRGEMDERVEAIKSDLRQQVSIESVTASWGSPGSFAAGDDIILPNQDGKWPTRLITTDYDFVDTYGMNVIAGRDFERAHPSDEHEAFLLNETAASALGWLPAEAVGKEIHWDEWAEEGNVKKGRVIGVLGDFHFSSLREAVVPLVVTMHPVYGQLSIKVKPGEVGQVLGLLESKWSTWAPEWPFEYEFLDQELAEQYLAEEKLATLSGIFTLLAILVACFGLFGLASFVVERRTKEIGIRKVLGASIRGLVLMLSRDFAVLVAAAFVIAAPAAYLLMSRWLEDFAYQVDVEAPVFLLAGAASLFIALATVSYHTVRAALGDPVRSLRAD